MHPILVVAKQSYISNVRQRSFIVSTLTPPFLILLMLLFLAWQAEAMMEALKAPSTQLSIASHLVPGDMIEGSFSTVGVIDASGLLDPRRVERPLLLFAGEAQAQRALLDGEIQGYFVVPEDYLTSGKVGVHSRGLPPPTMISEADRLRALLIRGAAGAESPPAWVERAIEPMHVGLLQRGDEAGSRRALASMLNLLLVLFLIMTIMTASQFFLVSMSEEKESRIIELLLSSMRPSELLAGKVVGLGALGLTQLLIWLGLPFLLLLLFLGLVALPPSLTPQLGGAVSPSLLLTPLFFLLGYLLYGAIGTFLGSIGSRPAEGLLLFSWLFLLLTLPLLVALPTLSNPRDANTLNETLPRLLSYFPLTAPTMMMLRLGSVPVPGIDIVLSLVLLVLAIGGVLWGGGRLFHYTLLHTISLGSWMRYRYVGSAGALLLLALAGMGYQWVGETRDLQRYPPPGRLVEMGGYELHLYCVGEGQPTVLLEAESGHNVLHWSLIQAEVARHTRICAYDRAGMGWSERGPHARHLQPMAEELHALLERSGERAPFVLVGHGMGGSLARFYTTHYPNQVEGLLLLDPDHELQPRLPDYEAQRQSMQWLLRLGLLRLLVGPSEAATLFAAYPAEVQPALLALFLRPQAMESAQEEAAGLPESQAIGTLPPELPLWVITPRPAWLYELSATERRTYALNRKALHAALAAQSAQGVHQEVAVGSRALLTEQPQIVVEAILAVVAATQPDGEGGE